VQRHRSLGRRGPETAEQLSRWAFTLVEIMIVIAIIGMLAVMALPYYSRARANAQAQGCVNNLHQIDGAKSRFALEYGEVDGDPVTKADIEPYFLKKWEDCPAKGSYDMGVISTDPTCNLAGLHTI
jgi:prepilin-type N-terminal cleavage/methylation domain-containing protein